MEKEMSVHPLVSVIIATYNRARIISRSVESVLLQTFKDYEIIVVDDGSSDGTRDLLRERFGGKLVYIRKEQNEGLSAARNTGIRIARGRYVAFLDDDDLWLPEKLEMQMGLMGKNPSPGMVYCNSFTVNERDEVLAEVKGTEKGAIFDKLLLSNCLGPPSGVLVAKTVFARTGYFDETLPALEDWDLWIRVSQCYEADFVDQPLFCYRIHGDNMSGDILTMQRATFTVLDKYWPGVVQNTGRLGERNRVYSNHCVNFAWKQYERGNREAFRDLILKALEYDPLHQVVLRGSDLSAREKALFEAFNDFWHKRGGGGDGAAKRKSYALHHIQLAWEYYHRDDLKNFRRSLARAFCHSYPRVPVRLALPFVASFLGRDIAEGLHSVKERLLKKRSGA